MNRSSKLSTKHSQNIIGGVACACLAALSVLGCSSREGGNPPATGGSATGGTVGTGGNQTGGSATGGVATGGSPTGGSATGGSATGGRVATGGGSTGGTSTGGAETGGAATGGRGGASTMGGKGGVTTSTGGAATGGSGAGGAAMTGGANSVAYIGCSMAYNIGTGYKRVGGKVMWSSDSYQTSAMVVQNWTDANSSSWQLFDQKMKAIGGKDVVKAIMVQICIFSSRATDAELRNMVASARKHVNPGTHIYMVGQPQYEPGHECSLAGDGGAKWTDDQAQALAKDTSVNQDMTYLGKFVLDSTKGEVLSDSCHASSPTGENKLGMEAMAFFGG